MFISSRNTNTMSSDVYPVLESIGRKEKSRNGEVIRMPGPVLMEYTKPIERVNACPIRDANPFFHLMEAVFMLQNSDVNCQYVNVLSHFAANMKNYSDNGLTFNSWYGHRLRFRWGDQLRAVARALKSDTNTRQAVCQIWDPADLLKNTKDKACNMQLIFEIPQDGKNEGKLNMTVINRSNDAIWGSINGANVVHFSFIQEFVASMIGLQMGSYFQFSNNLHVYTDNPKWLPLREKALEESDGKYAYGSRPKHMLEEGERFQDLQADINKFCNALNHYYLDVQKFIVHANGFKTSFINNTVLPMATAFLMRKDGAGDDATSQMLDTVYAKDWRRAAQNWVERRKK